MGGGHLGWIIFSKVVYFFTASCLSHYTILGEIPPKNSGQSEVVKGSTKDSEISGQNTKEMAIISDINFFWPSLFIECNYQFNFLTGDLHFGKSFQKHLT